MEIPLKTENPIPLLGGADVPTSVGRDGLPAEASAQAGVGIDYRVFHPHTTGHYLPWLSGFFPDSDNAIIETKYILNHFVISCQLACCRQGKNPDRHKERLSVDK